MRIYNVQIRNQRKGVTICDERISANSKIEAVDYLMKEHEKEIEDADSVAINIREAMM